MEFPSPHGDKFQPSTVKPVPRSCVFPSPHGDKFQLTVIRLTLPARASFRPLTGINFNQLGVWESLEKDCFRPLTGINFNVEMLQEQQRCAFPSPHGDKFQRFCIDYPMLWKSRFPSPHGDKFQRL